MFQQLFENIEVGKPFHMPSNPDHSMECFIKLKHNKAKSKEDGRVVHFGDSWSVWSFEINKEQII
jgi:hypothetical protein